MFRLYLLGWCRHPLTVLDELIEVHVLAQGHLNRTNVNQFMETLWVVQRSIVLSLDYETFTLTNRHSAAFSLKNPIWRTFILHLIKFFLKTFSLCSVFVTIAIKPSLILWPCASAVIRRFASLMPRSDEWALGSTSPAHPPEAGTATMGTHRVLGGSYHLAHWPCTHSRWLESAPKGGRSWGILTCLCVNVCALSKTSTYNRYWIID